MTGPDPVKVLVAAQRLLRQGAGLDMAEEHVEIAADDEEREFASAIVVKMRELIAAEYVPRLLPDLGIPDFNPDGSLRFLAKSAAMRERAEAAHASQDVQEWIFFNGEGDDTIIGRVTETEIVHGQLIFTVMPSE